MLHVLAHLRFSYLRELVSVITFIADNEMIFFFFTLSGIWLQCEFSEEPMWFLPTFSFSWNDNFTENDQMRWEQYMEGNFWFKQVVMYERYLKVLHVPMWGIVIQSFHLNSHCGLIFTAGKFEKSWVWQKDYKPHFVI